MWALHKPKVPANECDFHGGYPPMTHIMKTQTYILNSMANVNDSIQGVLK